MDLQLYMRVLWRFKFLVGGGFLLAAVLAFLSVFSVDTSHGVGLKPRGKELWASDAMLFVTEQGFPWGYSNISTAPPNAQATYEAKKVGGPDFADPNRFATLAVLYSYLATSDQVKQIMRHDGGPIHGKIESFPVVSQQSGYGQNLPLITITGEAATPQGAQSLAARGNDAFRQFLEIQQARNGIPAHNRVLVTVVQHADKARLLSGRSKTLPIVIFLTIMIAVIGLSVLLENLRPRVRPVASEQKGARPGRTPAPATTRSA